MRVLKQLLLTATFASVIAWAQNQTPVIVNVSPSSGSTASQTFTVTVSDGNGAADINIVNLLINDALDGRSACYVAYQRLTAATGSLFLVNDLGDAGANLGYMPFPSAATLTNSQCTITGTGSTVSESGGTLTLNLNVTFKAPFGGNRLLYAAVRDAASNSGWKARGAWAVPPAKAMDPIVVSMTPARGTANSGVYTFRYQDPTGVANLGVLNVLLNDFLDGRVACYLAFSMPAQQLYLVEDLGNAAALIGPATLAAAGRLENSQCSVNLATSSAVTSGTNVDLTLDLTFTDKLAGDRIFYLAARSANDLRNSDWQAKGTIGFANTGLSTRLLSATPASVVTGQTVNISVVAEGTAFVAGAVTANFGSADVVVNSVTVNSATTLTINVAVGAAATLGARNLTVTQGTRSYQLAGALGVTSAGGSTAPPVISGFAPASGSAGTLVTVTGSNFGATPSVAIAAAGAGTIDAPVTSVTATTLNFVIPTGAASGPIQVATASAPTPGVSATPLTIVPSNTFTLSATPATVTLVRGFNAAFTVTLNSSNGFASLADLSLTGIPAGVTATFKPARIGTGQTSVITLLAPIAQALGTAILNVAAAGTVDGTALNSAANVSVQVTAPTTSFAGRTVVDNDEETPLAGASISFLGKDGNGGITACTATTKSDAAGNFLLANLPGGCTGAQLIAFNGLTVTSPAGKYAGVNIVFTLTAGRLTASPVLVHLPRIDNKETFLVTQNAAADQTYSYSTIPGLSLTVYAGTTLTNPDGSQPNPFPLVAVQVPVDRLPDAKATVPTMMSAFIVAFQPANAKASKPVAVFYPNTVFTAPGTSMTMMTLDPTRGRMVPYGTGRVSANGLTIVPDLDPAFPGKRYGIVNFDWHGPMPPPPNGKNPPPSGGGTSNNTGGCSSSGDPCGGAPSGGDPVDLASGLQIVKATDISINGARGRIGIDRVYRSGTTNAGSFGNGTQFEYDWLLSVGNIASQQAINLISPDGNQFLLSRQANGTFTNEALPFLRGAVLTSTGVSAADLRWKDGRVYSFYGLGAFALPRLIAITDRNGNKVTLTRNDAIPAQILSIADPVGRQLLLTWDSSNRVSKVTDPINRVVTYTYNPAGQLASVTDPAGGVTRYEYNAAGDMVRMFDQRGIKVFENTYDGPQVTQQVVADGGVYKFGYGFLIVLPGGGGPGSIGPRPGETIGATACFLGCPTTLVTDPLGKQTSYRFNWQGYVVSATDALTQVKKFDREPGTNMLLSMTGDGECPICGPRGVGDLYSTYDANGNRLTTKDALGNVTTYQYEPVFNNLTKETNALGQSTTYTYDTAGNLLTITDANGGITAFTYNANGLLTQVADAANQKTILAYSAASDLISATDPLGNVHTFRYDPVSRLLENRDRLGRSNKLAYDVLDRVTAQRDAKRQDILLRYDAVGNLLEVKDARGSSTLFSHDVMNRQISQTGALGKTATWTRDLMGNVTKYVDRRGQVSSFVYDDLYRPKTETYQDGASVSRIYDLRSHLKEVTDTKAGTFKFTYDDAGQLLTSSGPVGGVTYIRDVLRRVATRQVTGDSLVTYTYDAVGNLSSAGFPRASATFAFDAKNLMTGQTYSNAVASTYARDVLGRLQSIVHQKGAAILYSQVLKHDEIGSLSDSTNNTPQQLMTPAAGATFDAENRLLTRSGVTYTYDDEGNRTSESGPEGTVSYSWDTRGRLLSVTTSSGVSTVMKYDFQGLMMEKRVLGGMGAGTDRYLLDDLTNVVWMSQNGQSSGFLTGRSVDSHFAVTSSSTSVMFGSMNMINSTVLVTDAGGARIGQFAYEPFGKAALTGGNFPFSYTGRSSTTTDLNYNRFRHYDSNAGIFISQDPAPPSPLTNLYAYVDNNPLGSVDPFGLASALYDDQCLRYTGSSVSGCASSGSVENCNHDLWCAAKDVCKHPTVLKKLCVFGVLCDILTKPDAIKQLERDYCRMFPANKGKCD